MKQMRDKLKKFYQYIQNIEDRRILRAVIKSIPYIGEGIDELINGGDIEDLIRKANAESESRQIEILNKLDVYIERTEIKTPTIICVGGGNAEEILKLDEELVVGDKHSVIKEELIGGSAVNYSMRLLTAGYDVLPILAIGNDRIGDNIRSELLEACKLSDTSSFVSSFITDNDGEAFFDPYIQTSSTTILLESAKRTIFTQKLRNGEHFVHYLKRRLKDAIEHASVPAAVVIGHIHSDSESINPKTPGECTILLIDKFKSKSLVYTNFGKSQINLRFEFWKDHLSKIDIFQLNLSEAKLFFSQNSLVEIVSIIRETQKEIQNMSVVITLDRFGAIGVHKELPDSIIISWPMLEVKDVVDPTGAGDAFAAGMVSHLCANWDPKKGISSNNFQCAIEKARLWAAHACSTYGGSGKCPDQETLEKYQEKINPNKRCAVEVRNKNFIGEVMTLLDIAFQ